MFFMVLRGMMVVLVVGMMLEDTALEDIGLCC